MNDTNRWDPTRRAYLYIVCLVTLIMAIVSAVNLVRAVVEIAYPQPESVVSPVRPVAPGAEATQISEEELARERTIQRQWNLRSGVLNLVGYGVMLSLAVPLYLYHWRKVNALSAMGS